MVSVTRSLVMGKDRVQCPCRSVGWALSASLERTIAPGIGSPVALSRTQSVSLRVFSSAWLLYAHPASRRTRRSISVLGLCERPICLVMVLRIL